MTKKNYKISKKDSKYFKKRVKYWIKVLGCTDFEIEVRFEKNDGDSLARYTLRESGACIGIWLNKNWDEKKSNKKALDKVAFHEVFESTYLGPLRGFALASFNNVEIEIATHKSVRRAENTIFKAMKGY